MVHKVSIIIINYNGIKFIRKCLDSVIKIDYLNYEVIVFDNGSTDGSREVIEEYQDKYENVHAVFYLMNLGLALSSNIAAMHSTGSYLFFLNNDTLVDKDILTHLVNYSPDFTGVLGCRMGNYDGTRELCSFISVDRFGYPSGSTSSMFYPDGAIFINKDSFNEIGGFDEKLFLYGEDRDLCWRMWLAGYMCLPCNTAVFYHASSCISDTNYKRRRIAERNMIRSMIKNYSTKSLWSIIPQYLVLSTAELLVLLFTGRGLAIIMSYIPAYWWNVVNFKDTMEQRKKVQRTRRVGDDIIRKVMSKEIGKIFVLKKFGIPKFIKNQPK